MHFVSYIIQSVVFVKDGNLFLLWLARWIEISSGLHEGSVCVCVIPLFSLCSLVKAFSVCVCMYVMLLHPLGRRK